MPGKKDFVSIRKGDQRAHVQKRLMLGNLKKYISNLRKSKQQIK